MAEDYTVTIVSGSTGSTKLKFDNIHDLILGEDIHRKTSGEYLNSLLSAEDKGRGRKQDRGQKHNRSRSKSKKRAQSKNIQDITCWIYNQKGHFQNQCLKHVTSGDKEVNMATRDYDDALVCCVENTIDERIMYSGASFHATYCKEELERFKLYIGFRIPKKEWQGKEVSLAYLRAFGCDSYVKVKDVTRDKLVAKSVKCTFIGYGSDEMRYRFWDSKSHMVIHRRDVTFNKDSLYKAKATTDSSNLTKPNQKDQVSPGRSLEKRVRGPKIVGASRIVEDQLKKTLKTKQTMRREASRLYTNCEPESYPEALSSKEFIQWKKAINEEMVSFEKNHTWSLVRLQVEKKALQSKLVFRVKEEHDEKKRYKARLLVKGLQQKQGVDYNEIFSLIVKITTIRLVLTIVAAENLHLEQLDVKTTFLHSNLDEDIYMTQPEGFQSARKKENLFYTEGGVQEMCYGPLLLLKESCRKEVVLEGFFDSDYGGCLDSSKSTTEAKYMAIAEAGKELVWLKTFLEELDRAQTECRLFCDNQSTIHLAKNLVFHSRTKHIKIRYHYILELVSEGTLSLKKILGAKNPADMLTKGVTTEKLKLCAVQLASEITDERRDDDVDLLKLLETESKSASRWEIVELWRFILLGANSIPHR
nr:retrovirus-related Pol polyprotein from transposon TNT 1-94 [Tanacetum cinerariifolium]